MGYLNKADGIPDFSKAVISLLFRVPQDSINAAHARSTTTPLSKMDKTIPLLTFGVIQDQSGDYVSTIGDVALPQNAGAIGTAIDAVTEYHAGAGTTPLDPSYIGLDCTTLPPKLVFHFQKAASATLTNGTFAPAGGHIQTWVASPPGSYPAVLNDTPQPTAVPGTGWDLYGAGDVFGFCSGLTDITQPPLAPEYFRVETPVEITGDTWHHLLLSPDLNHDCTTHGPPQPSDGSNPANANTAAGTSSFCKLWYAIDDVNYNGASNLGPYFVDGQGDQNAILSNNTWDVAANSRTGTQFNVFESPATATLAAGTLPSNGADFGIPAASSRSSRIEVMQRAVLQIYTGITLDTSVVGNRRAFIKDDGKPEMDFSIADTLLGKSPEIRFGYDNFWKAGTNQGTAGNFAKSGTVNTATGAAATVDITP